MVMDNVPCSAAVVLPVERGSALQTDGLVAGLTEEAELLGGVQGAEDRARQPTLGLQLLDALDSMGGRPSLPPRETERQTDRDTDRQTDIWQDGEGEDRERYTEMK